MARYPSINVMRGCHEARIYLAGSDARAGDFALAAMAVLQIASGALSNQHVLEEKTVAGWVAENQTALLYLMTPSSGRSATVARAIWQEAAGTGEPHH